MKSVAFHTLGCKVNQYETDAIVQLFENEGYNIVSFKEKADIYIVNTCTVTNMADKKSRQIINKVKKQNNESIVVVVGCYAQAAKESLEKEKSIDLVIGNNKKNDVLAIVENYMNQEKKKNYVIDINQTTEYEPLKVSKVDGKTRAYIKIQDGCNQFCTYCIIPFMRGRVRSRIKEDVLKEIHTLMKNGYKEVVLTGIHLASYGKDLHNVDLLSLLKEANEIEGLERIRLGSLDPNLITEKFAKEISLLEKVCPHFHLSLQSGDDETLKRMNRKYTTKEYAKKVSILREYYDYPAITTDIIVGFPGETEDEFNHTCEFVSAIGFSDVHVFKYSKREGTKAADFKNQVPEQIKSKRSQVLIQLTQEQKHTYIKNFLNKNEEVLFEEMLTMKEEKYTIGHTKRYIKVAVKEKNIQNQIHQVKINENINDLLMGEIKL
ncbi:threonylcarbamoyladenosine tRNA methylthiotransferase MtaB [Natranaerovirga hydrolytica]|uniref:Threonylcarbamoyladenosine tRNA methylthiotransferase MtaB n=1 Tax=Natranaerovirga hydrolytica TaxID=680378 RepID=A0A4R1N0J9_9FIRM|nr:tRNA (N(6)-L-threonylcarbamoyladenosine(37)-C(2))-methylthiotransferase MtaB [Natranaerovirga hydrolytica]TCK98392.1 threonylcarbamoyladenosine tRNA methylthiotransferase MtaB [Natranaerovirga hydrolytica]